VRNFTEIVPKVEKEHTLLGRDAITFFHMEMNGHTWSVATSSAGRAPGTALGSRGCQALPPLRPRDSGTPCPAPRRGARWAPGGAALHSAAAAEPCFQPCRPLALLQSVKEMPPVGCGWGFKG